MRRPEGVGRASATDSGTEFRASAAAKRLNRALRGEAREVIKALAGIALIAILAFGALVVAALALAHVLSAWAVVFFYVVPGLVFSVWGLGELSPRTWRRILVPLRRRWRTSRISPSPAARPAEPAHRQERSEPPLERALRPWLGMMRAMLALRRRRVVARLINVVFGLSAVAIAVVASRNLASRGWPLGNVNLTLTAASCAFFLTSVFLKSLGWQLLFRRVERPTSLCLAAATGAAAVAGLALPGRLDDALRVAVVRRMPGRKPGVGTIALSLFLLGLVDAVALAPLAAVAAATAPLRLSVRAALGVVAFAGVGAAVVLSMLPRVRRYERLRHYRLSRWLDAHAPSSLHDSLAAAGLVTCSWAVRGTGVFVLLHGLGFALSFPLALAYLAAGAASAALPIGPAGAATQAGVGAAALTAAGIDPARAVAFAIVAQGAIVVTGGAVALYAAGVLGVGRLRPA